MTSYQKVELGGVISSAASGFASGAKASEGIPQVRMNNVETDGTWNWTKMRRVPPDIVRKNHLLTAGDVLFNATNSPNLVGKSAHFDGFNEPVVFSNHFVRLRPKVDLLHGRYLTRWLNLLWKSRIFESGCTQWVNQATYRKQDLLKLQIPLPPLAEQKRIAAILDAADALRAKRRESLAELDRLLQSTFLDLFGDPVTNPKGWDVKPLGESCDLLTGFAFPSSQFIEPGAGVALCRGINVGLGNIRWKDRVDWPVPYDQKLSRFEIREDDIILAMDRPWIAGGLKVAVATPLDLPALLVQRVARIRAKDAVMQRLIYALINSDFFEHHCNPTETTVPHISPKDLNSFPIIQPPTHHRHRFATIVESIERQKTRLRAHLAELDTLFASLQSRAFNGQL